MDLSIFNQNNLLYTQESLSRYLPGGYHPVTLGDSFKNDRYKVHHKLGWGGFSTVWLAHDRNCNQWVSLKILTANAPVCRELQILKFLEGHAQGDLSSNYIVQLLDDFTHEGPNGVHQCLVFELLGPSVDKVLSDYREGQDKPWSETVLRMSTQLLKAIKFLHNTRMCHRDISGRNIAFTCSHLREQTEEQLFAVLGIPEVEPLKRLDGAPLEDGLPTQLVTAAKWVDWIEEDEEDIRLFDFGESFLFGEEPDKLTHGGPFKAPETIFTDTYDYRVDLWQTGCMIHAFVFTAWPFWYLGEDECLVFQMIGFVERLPAEWESKWVSMSTESHRDLVLDEDYDISKLVRKFAELMTDPELQPLQPLLPVIQGLMRFLPSNRRTAGESLDLLGLAEDEHID